MKTNQVEESPKFARFGHANGHLLTKTQAERHFQALDAEHPDSPCLIQEQTAVVMPQAFYLSNRGKLHFKVPSVD